MKNANAHSVALTASICVKQVSKRSTGFRSNGVTYWNCNQETDGNASKDCNGGLSVVFILEKTRVLESPESWNDSVTPVMESVGLQTPNHC